MQHGETRRNHDRDECIRAAEADDIAAVGWRGVGYDSLSLSLSLSLCNLESTNGSLKFPSFD